MNLPGLAQLLQAFDAAEFRERTPVLCTAHRETWPYDVRDRISKAEHIWRRTAGRIQDRGLVTACVETEGAIWCVLRIYFVRVAEDEISEPVANPPTERAGGVRAPSHDAARTHSPILNEG